MIHLFDAQGNCRHCLQHKTDARGDCLGPPDPLASIQQMTEERARTFREALLLNIPVRMPQHRGGFLPSPTSAPPCRCGATVRALEERVKELEGQVETMLGRIHELERAHATHGFD